jgi:TolA-binding protein
MSENPWEIIKDLSNIIGAFFLPLVGWMFYTVFQHSKKLAMLEQKVNDQINMRLDNLESKFDSLDEKMDHVKDSILENKVQIQENMNQKFGTLLLEIKKGNE